jgi:hypothetical protein
MNQERNMRRSLSFLAALGSRLCEEGRGADRLGESADGADGVRRADEARRNVNMKTPESVKYDAELDVFLCLECEWKSVAARRERIHRGHSRRQRLAPGEGARGRRKERREARRAEGPGITGDTLWVADINHVRGFNRKTGAPVADIDLSAQKVEFLK